jgi:hypothetical protein
MVKYQLVIARYNEDIDWSLKYNRIVYNKGQHIDESYIRLPNIGREAQTYLYHIVHNYDSLDDYTIFLQGHPFDHTPNLIEKLEDYKRYDKLPDFMHISTTILPTTSERDPNHEVIPMKDYYEYLFGNTPRKDFVFGAGAQFLVSREMIQSIPLHVYQSLLTKLENDTRTPGGAHVMERLWEYFFIHYNKSA